MIVVQTPLRASFLGGGTDLEDFYASHGGAVIGTTINKSIYVIVKERFDDMIYVNYSRKEIVNGVDELQHELIREAMKITGVDKGIEITTLADVPSEGTGLGSSSAITVGALHALYVYQGQAVSAATLAEQACKIEIDILGKPIGKQDQYYAAYGNMLLLTFDDKGVGVARIQLPPESKRRLNDSLLLFYTGRNRKAADILSEQKKNISREIDALSELRNLAYKAKEAIIQGSFDDFGRLMHQGWELKKRLADKITDAEIEEIYGTALKAGAIGGKILGAGGGGFLLLYCPKSHQDNVCSALRHFRQLPFRFQSDGSKVIFNYRSNE